MIPKLTSSCRAKPSKFDTRSPCLGHQSSALRKLILGSDHHNYYCLLFLMQLDRMIDDRMLSFHSQVLGIMAELRSKDEVWLVDGLATDSFPDNKLPTREEVLKVLEWHSRRNPRDLQGVVRKTSLMLQVVWGRANIPMIDPTHLLKKVRQLREDYSSLKKSRSRESAKELEKRESFKAGLKQLFDVAHRDAMSLMTIQEDKDFLEFQRKPGRQGKMAGVDEKWCEKEGRRVKRKLEEEGRAEREKESRDKRTTSAVLEDSTSSSSADPSPSASPAKRTPREDEGHYPRRCGRSGPEPDQRPRRHAGAGPVRNPAGHKRGTTQHQSKHDIPQSTTASQRESDGDSKVVLANSPPHSALGWKADAITHGRQTHGPPLNYCVRRGRQQVSGCTRHQREG